MKIAVPDMTCGGCASAVERAVKLADAQAAVSVDLATKIVDIDSSVSVVRLMAAIEDAGFTPEPIAADGLK
jgi:copper chaperone